MRKERFLVYKVLILEVLEDNNKWIDVPFKRYDDLATKEDIILI